MIDRGILDVGAYLSDDEVKTLFDIQSIDYSKEIMKRYDYIFHLVTAANGAEKFFGNQNNQARKENLQMAIDIDENLQRVYYYHQSF